ncbi:MAG: patatin-like phospholipase family protein [Deltaproteobacteria bacterium]|nr:patatin-like phospholipase family protein [Deltaproteobacteria bacterium]
MGKAKKKKPNFALVLSGGGARGAYEAGVMYYIRTGLPKEIAHSNLFRIYTGTSVGAINCAQLASTAADPLYQGARLRKLWQELSSDDIYYADFQALSGFLVKSGFFMATNFFGLDHLLVKKAAEGSFPFKAVLDTTPFIRFLRRSISWSHIHENIRRREVDAVAIAATHMLSGKLTLFVEKNDDVHFMETRHLNPVFCNLSPKYVVGSAAIPIIFPLIRINRQFYGDGSMRQNTPMSPAIHMGADRLLVVSLHDQKKRLDFETDLNQYTSEPKVSDILGKLLNTIFLDKLDYDLAQMRRINHLIEDFEKIYGSDAMDKVNKSRDDLRKKGVNVPYLRRVLPFVISPSKDIGAIASDHLRRLLSSRRSLTAMHRFFARIVEGSMEGENDFISYLLFDRDYLEALIQLGYEDARSQHDNLVNFFMDLPLTSPETSG